MTQLIKDEDIISVAVVAKKGVVSGVCGLIAYGAAGWLLPDNQQGRAEVALFLLAVLGSARNLIKRVSPRYFSWL